MEPAADSISVRSMRLNEVISGPAIMTNATMNKELLFDAIILLFDEYNNAFIKTDPLISTFLDKCKCFIDKLSRCLLKSRLSSENLN